MQKYELEKKIWTETDFQNMGWHDSHIYKTRLNVDLEFDIDYILQWNKPEVEGLPFSFWLAPSTLVFREIKNLQYEIDTAFNEAIEIEGIELTNVENEKHWTIVTHQGNLEFISEGFTQYIRQEPFFEFGQTISYIERNGFSSERTTEQDNPNRLKSDFIEQRKKDLEHYENAKKRQLKRHEKESLKQARDNGEIELKEYLIRKREIKEELDFYDYWLKETIFEDW